MVIQVINDPPEIEILQPLENTQFCAGQKILLAAGSFDPNNCNECADCCLPDSSVVWTKPSGGSIGRGHRVIYTLPSTAGSHTVLVQGVDDQGAHDVDTVTVDLDDGSCESLIAFISDPPADHECSGEEGFWAIERDYQHDQRYANVHLEGVAFDPEDGTLTGDRFTWRTDRGDVQPCWLSPPPCDQAFLGNGDSITVRLYIERADVSACHTVTLRVTDSDGNWKEVRRIIHLYTDVR